MKFVAVLAVVALFALAAAEDADIAKLLSKNDTVSSTTAGTSDDSASSSTTDSSMNVQSTSESGSKTKDIATCTRVYKPVCGSNGKTYNNECMLQSAQKLDTSLKLAKNGEC